MNVRKLLKSRGKNTVLVACLAGAALSAVMMPICFGGKCPEKRFLEGGKEMLAAIPDIARKYTFAVVRAILP